MWEDEPFLHINELGEEKIMMKVSPYLIIQKELSS